MELLENKGKLEDQERILRLNKFSEVEKRRTLLRIAKEHNWDIVYAIIKNKQKDWKNFHIWSGNKTMIQRAEYRKNKNEPWAKIVIRWSIVKAGEQKRLTGDYGTIINTFCEEVEK